MRNLIGTVVIYKPGHRKYVRVGDNRGQGNNGKNRR